MAATPARVRLRVYKVGFGDCLLLTITYRSALPDGRRERHLLIDCGTMRGAPKGPTLTQVAELVAADCGGQLDAVVATHRHKDHIGGFGVDGARHTFDTLSPKLVIRPWTDVPDDQRHEVGLAAASLAFVATLDGLHRQAENVGRFAFDNEAVRRRAEKLAELGFKNTAAVALLEEWGRRSRAEYVTAGTVLTPAELPGVQLRVLGPPTIEQVPSLTSYAKESEEYWFHLARDGELSALLDAAGSVETAALDMLAQPDGVGAAEWLLRALDKRRVSQGMELVEAFDDVLNNTSVILLIKIGSRTLLFPGDAQAENWSFSLDQALGVPGRRPDRRLRNLLAGVDLYKVGHHGSRNASPRRLTNLWQPRIGGANPLVSVLTTQQGVYEKSAEGKVPRDQLVEGLAEFGPVHNTDDLPEDVWWMDLEAPTSGAGTFDYTPAPPRPPAVRQPRGKN